MMGVAGLGVPPLFWRFSQPGAIPLLVGRRREECRVVEQRVGVGKRLRIVLERRWWRVPRIGGDQHLESVHPPVMRWRIRVDMI